jgi:hypothetical protein
MRLVIRAFSIALFAVIKRWKIVLLLFFVNFFIAAFLALPLFKMFSSQGGRFGGLEDSLAHLRPEVLTDFISGNREVLNTFFVTAGAGGLLYFILFHLLSGGLIAILADPREKTTLKTFLRACGRYVFRYMRLLFYFLLFLVVLALLNSVLDQGLNWYFIDFQEYESGAGALGWLLKSKNILMLLLFAFALVSMNYAKTAAVVEDRHFMGGCMLRGMGFTLAHPIVTGFFFLLAFLTLALFVYAYLYLSRRVDIGGSYHFLDMVGGVTLSGALLFFLIAQVFQFLIQACLVFRHAGQVYIFKYLTVQFSHPDPELSSPPEPDSPFIPDRPYTGMGEENIHPDVEGTQHA